jgi:HAD superfamily hydrolase (TIGR01509 family)
MYKAVLWDIDGTLIDTEGLHFRILEKLCEERGHLLPCAPEEIAGLSVYKIWDALDLSRSFSTQESWIEAMHSRYFHHLQEGLLRSGIKEALNKIHQAGLVQIAVSNGNRQMVDMNLKQTGISSYFSHTISCDDVVNPKPDPEPYQKALDYLNIEGDQAVAVEDTLVGIIAAKKAFLTTFAFPNAHTQHLNFELADFVIEHPKEIVHFLNL